MEPDFHSCLSYVSSSFQKSKFPLTAWLAGTLDIKMISWEQYLQPEMQTQIGDSS